MAERTATSDIEGQREHVRRVAAQLAGESTSVVLLEKRPVSYNVPDRWGDGTTRGQNTGKQILKAILLIPLTLLTAPFVMLLGILADLGLPFNFPSRDKIEVHGGESCAALGFADAIRDHDAPLWLAWSQSQVALVAASEHEQRPTVLWRATTHQRPKLTTKKTPSLRWPDESRVEFILPESERNRITESNGTP